MAKASRNKRVKSQQSANGHESGCHGKVKDSGWPCITVDGVLHKGKEQVRSAYASLVQAQINSDQTENLDAIAAMGPIFQSDILDVELEIKLDLDGSNILVSPVKAALIMEKEKCFLWFLKHAENSESGRMLLRNFAIECALGSIVVDPDSLRGQMIRQVVRWLVHQAMKIKDERAIGHLYRIASDSKMIEEELQHAIGSRMAALERSEIVRELGIAADEEEAGTSPEAIESSEPEKTVRSWSRAL